MEIWFIFTHKWARLMEGWRKRKHRNFKTLMCSSFVMAINWSVKWLESKSKIVEQKIHVSMKRQNFVRKGYLKDNNLHRVKWTNKDPFIVSKSIQIPRQILQSRNLFIYLTWLKMVCFYVHLLLYLYIFDQYQSCFLCQQSETKIRNKMGYNKMHIHSMSQ